VFLIAGVGPAHADWLVTPFLGLKFAGSTNIALGDAADSTKLALGGMFTLIGDSVLGIEADFSYYPRFFEADDDTGVVARSNVLTLMGNVVVAMPVGLSRSSLRPYATAGAGLMHVGIDDIVDLFPADTNLFAVNLVRFDLRFFRNVTEGNAIPRDSNRVRLSFWRASVGVSLRY
jgi:hypothetical protein